MRLNRDFYTTDAYTLAINLLGKVICINQKRYRIVETEAYGGINDKAAHSYNNTRTSRTEVMYKAGGHVYVYLIYGMYHMLNIVASLKDNPEAVLIRAVEPLDDVEEKKQTNGPGKLCKYMGIDKTFNGLDLCTDDTMYIKNDDYYKDFEIVYSKRVNVDYAEEDKDRLWRFYIKNHPFVSKK
ncbi:MAG: 3-methyladenine glycosylase [Haloplasmataceae bacterium]|jgi:DNA-3-methyladenine glycosylase|nr:3-methyladenine glycosylase [Haloplasmataceae bacterium]